jgi:hypothetical protein
MEEGEKPFEPFLKTFDGIESVRLSMASAKEGIRVDGETPDGRKVVGVIMPIGK